MPNTITFDQLPMGYVLSAAKAGDAVVDVQYLGYTSTEDGQWFFKSLEGVDAVLRLLEQQCGLALFPSRVDHLLAIIKKDRTATVFVNEIPHVFKVRASRSISIGEAVAKNDIADFAEMDMGNLAIPPDAGLLYLFSVGWRKGLFYDFGPLHLSTDYQRQYDCSRLFAQLYGRLLFQERFSILESEWEALFAAHLFPFTGLKNETIEQMLGHHRAGWDLGELSETIVAEVQQHIPSFLESWRKHPVFAPHIQILECAASSFNGKDYISSSSVLNPRIEGILRTNHIKMGRKDRPNQSHLAESAVASQTEAGSLLLPGKFKEYIENVFFAGFSNAVAPCDANIALSRHSVAHGVVPPEAFTGMQAAISFLVLHQLFYCFMNHE